jgi:hypothetical protein
MKAHISGIVARRVAAILHITPIPSATTRVSVGPSPPLRTVNQSNPSSSSPTFSRPTTRPLSSSAHVASASIVLAAAAAAAAAAEEPSSPSYVPPLPANAEEELIQCTFILYVMLDAIHSKMRDDDVVLRQLYSILPELYPSSLSVHFTALWCIYLFFTVPDILFYDLTPVVILPFLEIGNWI